MDTFKLRLKVGPHEFEAEGAKDDVQAQFDAWKSLISGEAAGAASEQKAPAQPPNGFFNSFFAPQAESNRLLQTPRWRC